MPANDKAHPTRIAIVGAGNVGSTYAYALLLSRLSSEIVLIDANRARAEGEAMDLNHAIPFAHATRIWAGDYPDCAGAAITVLAAGTAQRPGETRLDMIIRNGEIWKQIIPRVVEHNPDGLLLVATNPVDALTYAALKLSGLPTARVIGSGTVLDTARFRYLLSQHFQVDSRSVHAYIIGEHGDSEVSVWSLANIAGMKFDDFCRVQGVELTAADRQRIYEQTRDAAYQIIERKGATYYAVAAGLIRITAALLRDQNTVFSVSTLIENYYGISDVCLSLPAILNRDGVRNVLHLDLSPDEQEKLRRSADILKSTLRKLDL
ncbi:MAG TPA: L-lactate dehydrogenase [Terriglobales bacterium]|nr:L-lactate dehydrogenase [Terriglobales bacterium]